MPDDLLTLRYVPISQIALWGRNAKRHDLGAIITSIQRHGFKDPLKFEPMLNAGKGGIVEGNGRDLALIAMRDGGKPVPRGIGMAGENGKTEWAVPVLFGVDAPSQAAAEAYGIDHNQITMMGGDFDLSDMTRLWEDDFTDLLKDLALADELPVSVEADDLDRLIAMEQEPQDAEPQIDRAAELLEKWQVKTGDLWRIGEHRLLCGDSTRREDVERVTQGERVAIVSDPPYGISVDTSWLSKLHVKQGSPPNKSDAKLIGDDGTLDLSWVYQYSEWLVFGFPFVARGEKYTGLLVWDKSSDLGSPVEVAASNAFNGYRLARHVWAGYYREAGEKREAHPTQKPIGIMVDAVQLVKNAIILDPFVGSGTTLVACQNLGRKGRAIEISPAYVSVCLQRMSDAFPGIQIERL